MEIVRIRKTGSGWEFESESALEDFVWINLQQLLGLTPLKRQYRVKDQICDIIAVDENKRLVVLELKNTEDRYIVQQLTRYYDALLEEKPFQAQIDYGQPVQLIAIAPNFHKNNLIDRKYHNLCFLFKQIDIIQYNEKILLLLKDIDSTKFTQIGIRYQEIDGDKIIPPPPRALLNLLSKDNGNVRATLLRVREQILNFDLRMKETSASGVIRYGKGKNKPCAEIRIMSFSKKPGLALWLPNPKIIFNKTRIGRMVIRTTDWNTISQIHYMPKGTMYTRAWWAFGEYIKQIGINKPNSLEKIVEIALETWLKRL